MKKNKGKIITLTSSKGGVGKTIFLSNLAGIYAKLEKKVLLLDFDLVSGTLALNLKLEPTKTIYNIVEDLANNRYTDYKDYVVSYSSNIDVVSSPKDPRQSTKIDAYYLIQFLKNVEDRYDVILIDTTHGFHPVNLALLDKTDIILYMITNDFMDLKNSRNFMSIMKAVDKDNVKVILNNARDLDLDYFSNFDIKTTIGHPIDYTISDSFHIRDINQYLLEGKIFILNKTLVFKDKKDYKKLVSMAQELLEGEE